MKLVVLNGSPKGSSSVTLQYVRYLAKKHPDVEFEIHHVAQRVGKLEKDADAFAAVVDAVRSADGVIWSFPLYYGLVASQYKRFIELLFGRNAAEAFAGKYALSLSTSIHFFDHAAHNYIQAVSDDLGMRYAGHYSARMTDLTIPAERTRWLQCFEEFSRSIEEQRPTQRRFAPLPAIDLRYEPSSEQRPVDTASKRIVILHDCSEDGGNLGGMIDRLAGAFGGQAELINLREIDIRGGCLGCCKCGLDGECVYEGKDGFIEFFRSRLVPADIIVFAGTVVDRNLSWHWRRFFDRSFFNGHRPAFGGKRTALLIAGPAGHIPEIAEFWTMLLSMGETQLVDIITDEAESTGHLDGLIDSLAARLVRLATAGYAEPAMFPAVAGRKLFRDEIWGSMRFVFQADHRAYVRMGWYKDFPQRDWKCRLTNAVFMALTKIPSIRRKLRSMLVSKMVEPLEKVVDDA